ncbi:MAG: universal stress protein [Novosphingobium sp.]|nr:universal stress protein [Novosphingobium sp.]
MRQNGFPARIALATDLSHRCDRAFDRALMVADAWAAQLMIVHALAGAGDGNPPDPVRAVRERIYRDMVRDMPGADISIHVESGSPAPVILDAAGKAGVGLIVTGVARDRPLMSMLLGDTVDRLVRKSPVPVLIVRDRAFEPYRTMVVATDFSVSARIALETAVRFFPDTAISLFHAYDVPFANYLGGSETERRFEAHARGAAETFLAESNLPSEAVPTIERRVEHGVPEALLRDYARTSRRHLTVVGTHGGGLLYETVIGSTARKIIDAVPGDVLLVPDPARRKVNPAG